MKSRICGIGLRIVREESGQSLLLALIVVMALTISTAGLITFMQSNESSFGRDRSSTRALSVAEAGIQNASSIISQYDDATDVAVGTRLPPGTAWNAYTERGGAATGTCSSSGAPSAAGEGCWSATKTTASGTNQKATWLITAISKSAVGGVTRKVEAKIGALPPLTVTLPIFGYALYVGGSGSPPTGTVCANNDSVNNTYIGGGFTATGNFWVGNNLCLSGNNSITLPSDNYYTLYVGGGIKVQGSAKIADPGPPPLKLKSATVVNGCNDNSGSVSCSTTNRSQTYAYTYNQGSSFTQASLKPPIDWTVWTAANWNSSIACSGLSSNNVFEKSSESYTNPVPTRTLTLDNGGTAYLCYFSDSAGNFVGSIAYTTGASSILTISGKVFMNANLDLTSNIRYQGNGTLYVNGTVNDKQAVCGYPTTPGGTACAGSWDQRLANIEIVAMNAGNCASTQTTPCTATGWSVTGNGEFDGIAFVRGALTGTGNGGSTANFKGPVLTDFVDKLNGGGGLYFPSDPPTGSEGVTQTPQPWALIPGTWRQLTN